MDLSELDFNPGDRGFMIAESEESHKMLRKEGPVAFSYMHGGITIERKFNGELPEETPHTMSHHFTPPHGLRFLRIPRETLRVLCPGVDQVQVLPF